MFLTKLEETEGIQQTWNGTGLNSYSFLTYFFKNLKKLKEFNKRETELSEFHQFLDTFLQKVKETGGIEKGTETELLEFLQFL